MVDMACNRNGSRTLETIWRSASMNQKVAIATELGKQEDKIRSDQFGRFAHKKFGIYLFLKRRNDWKGSQVHDERKRKLFQDIIGDQGMYL